MKDCERYDHVPVSYDVAFWRCKICDIELMFVPTPLSQTENLDDLGECIKCGMDPRDFYGQGSKQGLLCDLNINNGVHDWLRGCTCTKQPHAEGCAFYRPVSQTEKKNCPNSCQPGCGVSNNCPCECHAGQTERECGYFDHKGFGGPQSACNECRSRFEEEEPQRSDWRFDKEFITTDVYYITSVPDRLKAFIEAELQQTRENVRRGCIELVKELGRQQDDDTIWVNMDELLARLKNES